MLQEDGGSTNSEGSGGDGAEEEREITPEENDTIIASNKYLVTDPRFKSRYDAVDILISGNIPELKDNGERFVCASEIGKFILSNGVNGCEENIAKLFATLDASHILVLCQILDAQQISKLVNHPATKEFIKQSIGT